MKSTIDYAKLRQDLINYYCAGMKSYPQAIYKLVEVERASPESLFEGSSRGEQLFQYPL